MAKGRWTLSSRSQNRNDKTNEYDWKEVLTTDDKKAIEAQAFELQQKQIKFLIHDNGE